MGFFDNERDAHEQVMRGEHHEAKTSHEASPLPAPTYLPGIDD